MKLLVLCLFIQTILSSQINAYAKESLFETDISKEEFAKNISYIIERAWSKEQEIVEINDIYVDGSRGILLPGSLSPRITTSKAILKEFDKQGRSEDYIACVNAIATSLENGIRTWQTRYSHENIPFPRGASCVYTLPPTFNVPVMVGSGKSSGDKAMVKEALYNYMLFKTPSDDKNVLLVLKAASFAIEACFIEWKKSCFITGILASGGIAPQPIPMGPGPGLVSGAKGEGGRLTGSQFNGALMYSKMYEYYEEQAVENNE